MARNDGNGEEEEEMQEGKSERGSESVLLGKSVEGYKELREEIEGRGGTV